MTVLTIPRPGDKVAPLERTLELADLVAYGGATWDWHRMHYDAGWARTAGVPSPVVDGQQLGALLAEAVQDWLGPQARLRRLGFRFAAPVFAGDTVRCTGTVTDVREASDVDGLGPGTLVEIALRVNARSPEGEPRPAVAPADATVWLPADLAAP